MKLRSFLTALGLLAAGHLSAGPILVGQYAGNSGDDNEKVDVRNAITAYAGVGAPLPQLFGPGSDPSLINGWSVFAGKTTTVSPYYAGGDDKTIDWTAPSSFSAYYIMTKWGGGGANFDHVLHYVLAGETLNYNPNGVNPPNGLSHLAIWAVGPGGQVPDGGSASLLLGASLLSLGLLRRRIKE